MDAEVYDRMALIEGEHWWFVARRQILDGLLSRLIPTGGGRILEVGCGTGGNLALLQRHGCVSALEPNAEARRLASEKASVEILEGFLPHRIPFDPSSFDLVAAFDVVEHLDKDRESVQALAALLKPGGRIVLTVPAFQFLWSEHDERHHHKRRYTRDQIERLLAGAGLRLDYSGYFNMFLFPLVCGVRLAKRLLSLGGDEEAMPPRTLNNVLRAIFASERHLVPRWRLPFGLSIVAVATKAP